MLGPLALTCDHPKMLSKVSQLVAQESQKSSTGKGKRSLPEAYRFSLPSFHFSLTEVEKGPPQQQLVLRGVRVNQIGTPVLD